MEKKDIYSILEKGERVALECKKAENSIPKSFWNTYSAFANTNGGIVLLGVSEDLTEKDKAKRYEITGVNNADKICKDLWNTINSNEKVNINLLHNEDV